MAWCRVRIGRRKKEVVKEWMGTRVRNEKPKHGAKMLRVVKLLGKSCCVMKEEELGTRPDVCFMVSVPAMSTALDGRDCCATPRQRGRVNTVNGSCNTQLGRYSGHLESSATVGGRNYGQYSSSALPLMI